MYDIINSILFTSQIRNISVGLGILYLDFNTIIVWFGVTCTVLYTLPRKIHKLIIEYKIDTIANHCRGVDIVFSVTRGIVFPLLMIAPTINEINFDKNSNGSQFWKILIIEMSLIWCFWSLAGCIDFFIIGSVNIFMPDKNVNINSNVDDRVHYHANSNGSDESKSGELSINTSVFGIANGANDDELNSHGIATTNNIHIDENIHHYEPPPMYFGNDNVEGDHDAAVRDNHNRENRTHSYTELENWQSDVRTSSLDI